MEDAAAPPPPAGHPFSWEHLSGTLQQILAQQQQHTQILTRLDERVTYLWDHYHRWGCSTAGPISSAPPPPEDDGQQDQSGLFFFLLIFICVTACSTHGFYCWGLGYILQFLAKSFYRYILYVVCTYFVCLFDTDVDVLYIFFYIFLHFSFQIFICFRHTHMHSSRVVLFSSSIHAWEGF